MLAVAPTPPALGDVGEVLQAPRLPAVQGSASELYAGPGRGGGNVVLIVEVAIEDIAFISRAGTGRSFCWARLATLSIFTSIIRLVDTTNR